jgi:hypothetical protein
VNVPPSIFDGPRSYLFVSAQEPLAAAEAVSAWADGPPDLCVTSPSSEAHETAAFAHAGHHVRTIAEPLLSGRRPGESGADAAARYATALRILYALDTRAALVVLDDSFAEAKPFVLDANAVLERADWIDQTLPLP